MSYTTAGALRRTDQVYYEQVSERHTLEHGLAFFCSEFPDSPGDNAFREVWIEQADDLQIAWQSADAFYGARGLRCFRWVPALAEQSTALGPFLEQHGMRRVTLAAFQLTSWPELVGSDDIRVLPARAMRRAFRSLFADEATADVAERRLDYPQNDMFIAMRGDRAVGRCALFQAGEVAEVRDLFVAPDARRTGVGRALLGEVLALARRLLLRTICACVDERSAGSLAFLRRVGFDRNGELIEFRSDALAD